MTAACEEVRSAFDRCYEMTGAVAEQEPNLDLLYLAILVLVWILVFDIAFFSEPRSDEKRWWWQR